jgi:hypothetical protein
MSLSSGAASKAEQFLANAVYCLRVAEEECDPQRQQRIREIAKTWLVRAKAVSKIPIVAHVEGAMPSMTGLQETRIAMRD